MNVSDVWGNEAVASALAAEKWKTCLSECEDVFSDDGCVGDVLVAKRWAVSAVTKADETYGLARKNLLAPQLRVSLTSIAEEQKVARSKASAGVWAEVAMWMKAAVDAVEAWVNARDAAEREKVLSAQLVRHVEEASERTGERTGKAGKRHVEEDAGERRDAAAAARNSASADHASAAEAFTSASHRLDDAVSFWIRWPDSVRGECGAAEAAEEFKASRDALNNARYVLESKNDEYLSAAAAAYSATLFVM